MTIKIGTIIKALRHEQKVTQEALAVVLGVTPQAISRWESENGYPDIELLPALADFFAVSVDELIGYRQSEREAELSHIKNEIKRLKEVGSPDERISYARKALIKFPGDNEIKSELALCLYILYIERKDEAALSESEALCNSVLENCTDIDIKCETINALIHIYAFQHRSDKALELADTLTPMQLCREGFLANGIGDGNTELYIQNYIDSLASSLAITIRNYAIEDDLPNDETTWDKKIEMLKTSNEIFRLIYGDNLMYYHAFAAMNHWLISTYLIAQGKTDETLTELEKMCDNTLAGDRSYEKDHGKHFTSIFTDKLIYPEPGKNFYEPAEHNQCYYNLVRLNAARYDGIRNHERFRKVVNALKEKAR